MFSDLAKVVIARLAARLNCHFQFHLVSLAALPQLYMAEDDLQELNDKQLMSRFFGDTHVSRQLWERYSISNSSEVIGRGSFGLVVQGISADGLPVAAKLQSTLQRGANPLHTTWPVEGPLWEKLRAMPHRNIHRGSGSTSCSVGHGSCFDGPPAAE